MFWANLSFMMMMMIAPPPPPPPTTTTTIGRKISAIVWQWSGEQLSFSADICFNPAYTAPFCYAKAFLRKTVGGLSEDIRQTSTSSGGHVSISSCNSASSPSFVTCSRLTNSEVCRALDLDPYSRICCHKVIKRYWTSTKTLFKAVVPVLLIHWSTE